MYLVRRPEAGFTVGGSLRVGDRVGKLRKVDFLRRRDEKTGRVATEVGGGNLTRSSLDGGGGSDVEMTVEGEMGGGGFFVFCRYVKSVQTSFVM